MVIRTGILAIFCAVFLSSMALSQSTSAVGKKKATKSTAGKSASTSASRPKAAASGKAGTTTRAATGKAGAAGKTGTARRTVARNGPPARPHQLSPTPERYRDIQQALADKGYLKQEPNGVWDDASVEALKQFQNDQKLQPTGKITAASLIGLGLGPKASDQDIVAPAVSSTPPEPPR